MNVRSVIIQKYFSSSFLVDILTLVSLFEFKLMQYNLSILFLLRIIYFSKIIDKIKLKFILKDNITPIINLLILLSKVVLLCHIFACSFHFIGDYELRHNLHNWLQAYDL